MPLAGMEFDREVAPGMFAALGFDRFQEALLTLGWSGPSLEARLAVGLAEEVGGLPDLVVPLNAPLEIVEILPKNYTSFVRGAFCSGADAVDEVNRILRAIDPEIVDEFRQECLEFRDDFGFDPHADFMGNLAGEWLLGFRLTPEGKMTNLAAVRLADSGLFDIHLATLGQAFDLQYSQWIYRGAVLRATDAAARFRIALATAGDYLIVSEDVATVQEAVDAWADGETLRASPAWAGVNRRLPSQTALLGFVNGAAFFKLAAEEAAREGLPEDLLRSLRTLAEKDTSAATAVCTAPGLITVDWALSESVDAEVRNLVWHSLGASVARARELSMRTASMSNVRSIVTACLIHASENKNVWPDSLGVLLREGALSARQFQSPYDPPGIPPTADTLHRDSYYLYRPGTGLAPTEVVVCERELRDGGAVFGYADGYACWVTGDEAVQLLATMRAAAR
jgi:hypothetical protein